MSALGPPNSRLVFPASYRWPFRQKLVVRSASKGQRVFFCRLTRPGAERHDLRIRLGKPWRSRTAVRSEARSCREAYVLRVDRAPYGFDPESIVADVWRSSVRRWPIRW